MSKDLDDIKNNIILKKGNDMRGFKPLGYRYFCKRCGGKIAGDHSPHRGVKSQICKKCCKTCNRKRRLKS